MRWKLIAKTLPHCGMVIRRRPTRLNFNHIVVVNCRRYSWLVSEENHQVDPIQIRLCVFVFLLDVAQFVGHGSTISTAFSAKSFIRSTQVHYFSLKKREHSVGQKHIHEKLQIVYQKFSYDEDDDDDGNVARTQPNEGSFFHPTYLTPTSDRLNYAQHVGHLIFVLVRQFSVAHHRFHVIQFKGVIFIQYEQFILSFCWRHPDLLNGYTLHITETMKMQ